MSDPNPISEVGSDPPHNPGSVNLMEQQMSLFSSGMEAIFKKIADSLNSQSVDSSIPIKLVPFDPDETDSDITNWCTLNDIIIEKKNLEGVDLIIALTHCLKGRAATCLTKIQPNQMTWQSIREILISNFAKPMMMQDYFDQVIKFRLGNDETPAEAGMRLWQLIEKIPNTNLPENVTTGFAISVLSQCNDKICRELSSAIINSKYQLFRILRSFTLKRTHEDSSMTEVERKKFRPFRGACNVCGKTGHRGSECRLRSNKNGSVLVKLDSSKAKSYCYICQDSNHIASGCPKRYTKKEDDSSGIKQVNLCCKTAHGVLETNGN
ncbi:uncharacterized protein LOC121733572 [Aricia agestis]|uniref:uncharacterized protein LOC121733572 n=1 Tax=Aricia agestis TaxID=91739 RepID=UPI001C205E29|nr:uncharacterized protein LOC121733572 [Aricia agestis]